MGVKLSTIGDAWSPDIPERETCASSFGALGASLRITLCERLASNAPLRQFISENCWRGDTHSPRLSLVQSGDNADDPNAYAIDVTLKPVAMPTNDFVHFDNGEGATIDPSFVAEVAAELRVAHRSNIACALVYQLIAKRNDLETEEVFPTWQSTEQAVEDFTLHAEEVDRQIYTLMSEGRFGISDTEDWWHSDVEDDAA